MPLWNVECKPVKVDEPSVAETITILKGIQPKYEDYHHVKYTDEAIEAAANLSNRYIQDRFYLIRLLIF